jgi:hypothetical protein
MFKHRHFYRLSFSVLILLLAASAAVTDHLPQGETFTFKISSNLPAFTFSIIPEPHEEDGIIHDIEVRSGDEKNLHNI